MNAAYTIQFLGLTTGNMAFRHAGEAEFLLYSELSLLVLC
jgi:hypothetical protein